MKLDFLSSVQRKSRWNSGSTLSSDELYIVATSPTVIDTVSVVTVRLAFSISSLSILVPIDIPHARLTRAPPVMWLQSMCYHKWARVSALHGSGS